MPTRPSIAPAGARTLPFLRANRRDPKPRPRALTEIRGPYYAPLGRRVLEDVLEGFGAWVDSLKFAGGAFAVMPPEVVSGMIDLCHEHDVKVSTGGFIERVLTQGEEAVDLYLARCKELGFDVVEVSSGFVSVPPDDLVRLVERVREHGMEAKPEVGVRFGAGGGASADDARDAGAAIALAKRHLDAGARIVMIESEGITESVDAWRTGVPARIADEVGLDKVMFEAADPAVFSWYVKTFGPDVNLFVDWSQVAQLECLRQGIWGTSDTWGRIVRYGAP